MDKVKVKETASKVASGAAFAGFSVLAVAAGILNASQKAREDETVAHLRGQRHNKNLCGICEVSAED